MREGAASGVTQNLQTFQAASCGGCAWSVEATMRIAPTIMLSDDDEKQLKQ